MENFQQKAIHKYTLLFKQNARLLKWDAAL